MFCIYYQAFGIRLTDIRGLVPVGDAIQLLDSEGAHCRAIHTKLVRGVLRLNPRSRRRKYGGHSETGRNVCVEISKAMNESKIPINVSQDNDSQSGNPLVIMAPCISIQCSYDFSYARPNEKYLKWNL